MIRHRLMKLPLSLLLLTALSTPAWSAAPVLDFTVTMSEAVTVDTGGGTPRIAVDVGGVTRYASYTSGSGTATLTFRYTATPGDVDLDGVAVSSPVQLNGGTITDLAGNALTPLTFTPPTTTNVKVNYPSLSLDFVADADGRYTLNGTAYNDLPSFLTAAGGSFSRASVGTYFDSAGTLQTAASNAPRFDYDPVTHAAKGILIEESRTNIQTNSASIPISYNPGGATATVNGGTAPDGTASAELITMGSNSVINFANQYTVTSGVTYVQSVFIKPVSLGNGTFNLYVGHSTSTCGRTASFTHNSGTITATDGTSTVQTLSNGWYRLIMPYTASCGHSSGNITTGGINVFIPGSTFLIWGRMVEQASFATSYIPTTATTVTRAGDALSSPVGSWYDSTAHTATAKSIATAGNNAYSFVFEGTNAGVVKGLTLGYATATSYELNARNISGVNSVIGSGLNSPGTANTFALTYDASLPSIVVNGSLIARNHSSANLGTPTAFYVGSRNGGAFLNGWIQNVRYYPARVTDTQLQALGQ